MLKWRNILKVLNITTSDERYSKLLSTRKKMKECSSKNSLEDIIHKEWAKINIYPLYWKSLLLIFCRTKRFLIFCSIFFLLLFRQMFFLKRLTAKRRNDREQSGADGNHGDNWNYLHSNWIYKLILSICKHFPSRRFRILYFQFLCSSFSSSSVSLMAGLRAGGNSVTFLLSDVVRRSCTVCLVVRSSFHIKVASERALKGTINSVIKIIKESSLFFCSEERFEEESQLRMTGKSWKYGKSHPEITDRSKPKELLCKFALNSSAIITTPLYLFLTFLILVNGGNVEAKDKGPQMIKIDGDVIFGGMFPMHEKGFDSPCGTIKEEKGIQRMEAMLYALDVINKDPLLLPNITIGAMILDTCTSDTYALEQSMEFFRASLSQDVSAFKCEGGREPLYDPPKPVAGVIGAASSSVSVMVANILRLFKIPQISYASTSTELSDKTRFDYFSRVVPPDNFQAQAMVEIIKEFGWKYVITLATEGGYGEKGIASFQSLAENAGICIAVSERIARLMSQPEEFDELIERMSAKPQARVVVMFVDEDNTRRVLAAAKKANKTGQFLWVGSDSWGAKIHPVRDQEEVARGAITILPQRTSLEGFDRYFSSLRPKQRKMPCSIPHPDPKLYRNCRNIWFKEFWTHHFNCTFRERLPPGRNKCSGSEHIKHEQEGLVPFVVDAVYAMAHAFHNLLLEECGDMFLCDAVTPVPSGQLLLQYIRNVSFIGQQGREVKFNSDGDAPGSYFIYQYQKISDSAHDYVMIGEWTEKMGINMSKLVWTEGQLQNNESIHPISICSKPCPTGFIRNFQDACCWSCVPCPDHCIIFNDTCKPCDLGWAPTIDKISCYKLTPEHITWDSAWAIVPVVFSSIGLLLTLLTTITFIRFNTTPIIMASGRELCYVLLIGIALCYLMTFVVLSPPSQPMCASLRVGIGLGLCICYSAIFTKTNRISRIFNRGAKSVKRPSYTSPKSQIVICLGLVCVQLVGVLAWLLVEVPRSTEVYPIRLVAVLTCGISNISFMLSLGYNMILIILCTIYAFKTRKIPENFNEAKYIGFTMYSTCIVWLAFIPIYFGTNNDYKIQLATLCMSVNISASVALGCLFTPKVYIVIFQPYKNVRQGSGQVKGSSHSKNYGTSMRFTPRSQTAQSVLSTNHSSCQVVPPSTISQHVNGESQNLKIPQNNPPHPPDPTIEKSSIT